MLVGDDDHYNRHEDDLDPLRYKKNEQITLDLYNLELLFGKHSVVLTPMLSLDALEIEMLLPPLDILSRVYSEIFIQPSTCF